MRTLPQRQAAMRSHGTNLWKVCINRVDAFVGLTRKQRCAKRNKPDQCVYHPAPLTKGQTPHDTNSDQSSPRVNSFGTAYQSLSEREISRDSIYPAPKRVKLTEAFQSQSQKQNVFDELHKPLPDESIREDALRFDNGAGFINHSAVLAEHELSIGIQPPNDDTTPISKVSQLQIDRGATVLTLLRDLQAIERYIDK
jgi:hypothetical protein